MPLVAIFQRFSASLFIKFLLLLLLVVIPISVLVGSYNYQNSATMLKQRVWQEEQGWTTNQRNIIATDLVQEAERLEALSLQDEVQSRLKVANTTSFTQTAQMWDAAPVSSTLRTQYVQNGVGEVLASYRIDYPNRTFALLAHHTGVLLAVTDPSWPYFDLRNQSWWQNAARAGQVFITPPQNIPGIGQNIVMISVAIADRQNSSLVDGILVVGLDFSRLVQPVLDESLPPTESAWLVDGSGKVLSTAHSNLQSLPTVWLSSFKPKDSVKGSGVSEIEGSAGTEAMVVAYAPIGLPTGYIQNKQGATSAVNGLNWTVVRAVSQSLAYAALGGDIITLALGTLFLTLGVMVVVLIIVRMLLMRPIGQIERAMNQVAGGDFSAHVRRLSRDELGRLGERFNLMVTELGTLTAERIQREQEQQQVSLELRSSASEIHSSVGEQTAFAAQQASSLAEIATTFSHLSGAANRLAQYGEQVAAVSALLSEEHEQGNFALRESQQILAQLYEDSQSLGQLANHLRESSVFISSVMRQLDDIADETKLLALNATIEAAGAGDAGRRFEVIAREVQALADQSSEAASSAQARLGEVQEHINEVVAASEREVLAITAGRQQTSRLEGVMQAITQTMAKLGVVAQTIAEDTKEQRESSLMVAGTVEVMAKAGHQLAEEAGSVSREASRLSQLAERLHVQVSVN